MNTRPVLEMIFACNKVDPINYIYHTGQGPIRGFFKISGSFGNNSEDIKKSKCERESVKNMCCLTITNMG